MQYQDVVSFIAIVEEGSINNASKRLFIAQPSLSKSIKRLEQEFGVEFFRRSKGSSLELTQGGKLFLEMARDFESAHSRFEKKIRYLRDRRESCITFGITPQRAYDVVGPMLQGIFDRYGTKYYVEIRTRSTSAIHKGLLEGTIDVGLISIMDLEETLHYEELVQDHLWIYLREGSPLASKAIHIQGGAYPVLRLSDLADEPIVANGEGSNSRAWLLAAFDRAGVSLQRELIESSNWDSRLFLAESGRATLFTPREGVRRLKEHMLYRIHPDDDLTRSTCLVCRKEFRRDVRFKIILEQIKPYFSAYKSL